MNLRGPRCPACDGAGMVTVHRPAGDQAGFTAVDVECAACEGHGVTLTQITDLLAAILFEVRLSRRA